MSFVPFARLPDDARLWCFGASSAPDPDQAIRVLESMRSFVDDWTAHHQDLHAGCDWLEDRFLLLAVDESRVAASGCSIDALTGHLRHLGAELGMDLLDSAPVWYRDEAGVIHRVPRTRFAELARTGRVSGDTPVFDLTVTRLGDFRAGRLEAAASKTWHRRLLNRS